MMSHLSVLLPIQEPILVLNILMKITNVDVNLSALEKKAKEIEHIAHQLREMESISKEKSEELKYIG